MPLYDYQCSKCGEIIEIRHGFDDTHAEPCPKCGGELTRLFNPAGIVFKGSGFYITDSRKSTESKGDAPASGSKGDAPASGSKESAA